MRELERRFQKGEIRIEGDDKPKLRGYAVTFNDLSEVLVRRGLNNNKPFRERVLRGAFTKSLQRRDVKALAHHDDKKILGRRSNNTLQITEDEVGLPFTLDPNDTSYSIDLQKQVARRDIDGVSIGMFVIRDRWIDGDDYPIRELIEIELDEISIVSDPAYPTSSVALRELEEPAVEEAPVESMVEEAPADETVAEETKAYPVVLDLKLMLAHLQVVQAILPNVTEGDDDGV